MRILFKTIILASVGLAPLAAHAQSAIEGRVGRLESEMRAVQRKVFPGGSGQYVLPENSPAVSPTVVPGSPASSPVADLAARVDALESQLRTITGQAETNQHRLELLEDSVAAYRRTTDARLKALEGAGSTTSATLDEPGPTMARPTARSTPAKSGIVTKSDTASPTKPDRAPASGSKDPARAAKLAAVEKPDTGDAAEDNYLYGYRLWAAKLYPEAETQLDSVATTYPKSKRASYAQTLLGRAYLDDGMPSRAALALYKSYKTFPDGDRAPDALFYLADALRKAGKPASDVCKVYDELNDVYSAKISATMKADIAKGRATSQCK